MSESVEAFIYGKKIGTILLDNGKVFFEYEHSFKNSGLEISPLKLPTQSTALYINSDDSYFEGLAGVFHDSLPDKFGTKVIEKYYESKGVASHKLDVIQKLMFIGKNPMGAIEYRPSIEKEENHKELIDLQNFYENSKKVISGDSIEVLSEMLNFMNSAASAGGARAKATVGFNPVSEKMIGGSCKDLKKGFQHHIIKFDSENEKGKSTTFTKLEYLYMKLAKECNIDIPETHLIHKNGLSHYLIKRFDRRENGEKIHLHSAAGLTHSNFNIQGHYSYDSLFRLTRYLTKDQRAIDEQYRRMVFNIIARNQDDHAKNFSFLMDENGVWKISPAYDITYTNGQGYTKNHQLSLGGKSNDFHRKDLLDIAQKHSIKTQKADEIINETIEALSTFSKRALEMEIDKKLVEIISGDLRLNL